MRREVLRVFPQPPSPRVSLSPSAGGCNSGFLDFLSLLRSPLGPARGPPCRSPRPLSSRTLKRCPSELHKWGFMTFKIPAASHLPPPGDRDLFALYLGSRRGRSRAPERARPASEGTLPRLWLRSSLPAAAQLEELMGGGGAGAEEGHCQAGRPRALHCPARPARQSAQWARRSWRRRGAPAPFRGPAPGACSDRSIFPSFRSPRSLVPQRQGRTRRALQPVPLVAVWYLPCSAAPPSRLFIFIYFYCF